MLAPDFFATNELLEYESMKEILLCKGLICQLNLADLGMLKAALLIDLLVLALVI